MHAGRDTGLFTHCGFAAYASVWHNGALGIPESLMAQPNDSNADMQLSSGVSAFEAKHFATAMTLLSPLAEQGNADAQYRMAVMFQNGLGHVKNETEAYRWMRAAAEQGHALAQHGLGFMHLQGECARKDEAEAARWFRRAAEQGLAGSQMTLGMLYQQGLGVPRDEAEAKKWYQRAESGT